MQHFPQTYFVYCASLYCMLQVVGFVLKLKVCGKACVEQVYGCHFFPAVLLTSCLCVTICNHVTNFCITIRITMAMSDLDITIVHCLGHHELVPMKWWAESINVVWFDCSTNHCYPIFPPSSGSQSLRLNNIEIRPIKTLQWLLSVQVKGIFATFTVSQKARNDQNYWRRHAKRRQAESYASWVS